MSEQRIRKYILHLCICIVACALTALTFAADTDDALHTAVQGRWEGTLSGAFRSQDVSWHFEVDAAGVLRGYMGPGTEGMPSLPMENLVVTADRVSFDIPAQHGSFSGTVSADGIAGSWHQGTDVALQMKKKDFVFDLPATARAALLGVWEMRDRGFTTVSLSLSSGFSMERRRGTMTILEFTETEDGRLAGNMALPLPVAGPDTGPQLAIGVGDGIRQLRGDRGRSFPLVDIFVTEEGFVQFATDNGRSFSGKLINGVLVGEFMSLGRTSTRSFTREGQPDGFDLELSDAAWQRVSGRWYFDGFGNDFAIELATTDDGRRRGQLIFDDDPPDADPLLEVFVDGDSVRFTSLTGRTFSGSFVEEDGSEAIAGEYRYSNFPVGLTFTRTPD